MAEWAGTVILFERCAFAAEFLARIRRISKRTLRDANENWMAEFPYDLENDEVRMLSEVINRLHPLKITANLEQEDEEADYMESFGADAMSHRAWQKAKLAFIEKAEGALTPVTIFFGTPIFANSKKGIGRLVHGDSRSILLEAAQLMAGSAARVFSYEKVMELTAPKE